MDKQLPIYKLQISEDLTSDLQVDFVALVDKPAIEKNFIAFNENFVEPNKGEQKDAFLPRCISYVINEGKDNEQAVAICNSLWKQHFSADKVSFDYDDTLNTERGKELAKKAILNGEDVYVISARHDKHSMIHLTTSLGIDSSKVYATGSNEAKVKIINHLGITKHWDNNVDVIKQLGSIGHKFISMKFSLDEDRHIISGAAMLADVPIYRRDTQLGEYMVVFDAPTIFQIVEKFFTNGYNSNFNIMHDPNEKVQGVTIFESFICDSTRGIKPMQGFEDAKDGSWFISAKVNNPDVWAAIKNGTIKGFSVEGMFTYSKEAMTDEQKLAEVKRLLDEAGI